MVGSFAQASFFSNLRDGFQRYLTKQQAERELVSEDSEVYDAASDSAKAYGVEVMVRSRKNAMAVLEAPVTPNNVPAAKCVYKRGWIQVPGANVAISQFEIWTTSRGNADKEPQVVGYLKLREPVTFKDLGATSIPMKIRSLGWTTDRYLTPKGITETSYRKDVEIGGQVLNLVMKRTIEDIHQPVVTAELAFYTTDAEPRLVAHSSCQTQVKLKKP